MRTFNKAFPELSNGPISNTSTGFCARIIFTSSMFKNKSQFKFIVIEGIDGSGKTTIAKGLAKQLSCHYYRTPPDSISKCLVPNTEQSVTLREYIDLNAFDQPQMRFLFYLFGVVQASKDILSLLKTNHVVCDRYILSTLVYHRILDPQLNSVDFHWLEIVSPDYQILLEIHDKGELVDRLSQKNDASDNIVESNIAFLLKVQHKFSKLGLFNLRTDLLTIDEVLSAIIKWIETTNGCEQETNEN